MPHTKQDKDSHTNLSLKLYFADISRFSLLSREEESELARRIQNGDAEARERMINANLRLVAKIANGYANFGMAVEDLIGEGNIGLIKAAERFDPKFGVKFSTYAVWWIKQMIKRALGNQSRTIRLPLHVLQKLRTLDQVEQDAGIDLVDAPGGDAEELCEGVSRKRARELRQLAQPVISLDQPPAAGTCSPDHPEVGTMIADPSASDPMDVLISDELHENLQLAMAVLRPRELEVIVLRFGLAGAEPKTLDEVGKSFGVTRERIRQIQKAAIAKLQFALMRQERGKLPARPAATKARQSPRTATPKSRAIPRLEAVLA